MSAPILVLSSTNRNFPLSLERELKDRSFHRLGGLDEFIASPLRAQPFLLILEIGVAEDLERALIACEWAEMVQPLSSGRYLLLVAKNISLGDRAARFRGAEIAYFPLNARNLAFKLDLQLKLLAAAPAVSPAAREGSAGFFGELAAMPGRPERVMVLRGPSPKRGAWRPTENNGPGGKVRWRWVESVDAPKPDDSLKMRWEAESRSAPVYEEQHKAWVLDDPAADVKCLAKDKEIYSVRKEITHAAEKARLDGGAPVQPTAAPVAFSAEARVPESTAPFVRGGGGPPVGSSGPQDLTSPATPKASAGVGTEALKLERTAAAGGEAQRVFTRDEKAASAPVQAPKELGEPETGQISSAAARSTERSAGDRNEYQVPRGPVASRELGDLRGERARPAEQGDADRNEEAGATDAGGDVGSETVAALKRPTPEAYGSTPEPKLRPESGTPVSAFSGSRVAPEPQRAGSVGDLTGSGDAARSETTGKILYNHDEAVPAPAAQPKSDATSGEAPQSFTAPKPVMADLVTKKESPRAPAEEQPSFSASRGTPSGAPRDLTGSKATPAGGSEAADMHVTEPAAAAAGPELVARQARPAATQGEDLAMRADRRKDAGSVTFQGAGPQNTGASDVTRFKAGPQGEDTARISAAPRAAAAEPNVIGGGKVRSDDDASVKQRLSFVLTCSELGDQNSAWHPAGGHRIYLSAHHRYRGYSSLSELLPLWVYEGELPPEFLESALAWRFFDRMPQRFDSLAALPPGLTAELLRPGGLSEGDPRADGKTRAAAPAPTHVQAAGANSGGAAAGATANRPAGPWWRSMWSFFRGLLGR